MQHLIEGEWHVKWPDDDSLNQIYKIIKNPITKFMRNGRLPIQPTRSPFICSFSVLSSKESFVDPGKKTSANALAILSPFPAIPVSHSCSHSPSQQRSLSALFAGKPCGDFTHSNPAPSSDWKYQDVIPVSRMRIQQFYNIVSVPSPHPVSAPCIPHIPRLRHGWKMGEKKIRLPTENVSPFSRATSPRHFHKRRPSSVVAVLRQRHSHLAVDRFGAGGPDSAI